MDNDRIETILLEVLRDVQTLSGRPWKDLDPTDKPIGSLEGFDSLSSVEATVMLEKKLGCRDLEIDSLFISEDGKRALALNEISHRISKALALIGGKK